MDSIIETKQVRDMLDLALYWMVKNMKGTSFDQKIVTNIYIYIYIEGLLDFIFWRIARFSLPPPILFVWNRIYILISNYLTDAEIHIKYYSFHSMWVSCHVCRSNCENCLCKWVINRRFLLPMKCVEFYGNRDLHIK